MICKKFGLFPTEVEIDELIHDTNLDSELIPMDFQSKNELNLFESFLGTDEIWFPQFAIGLDFLAKKTAESNILDEPVSKISMSDVPVGVSVSIHSRYGRLPKLCAT